MNRIRNDKQYRKTLARVESLEQQRASEFGSLLHPKVMDELLALGAALDAYELVHVNPVDRNQWSN